MEIECRVCKWLHLFKVTSKGFVVCNDRLIKIKDEKGWVNFFGSGIEVGDWEVGDSMMESSIRIPESLIMRSLRLWEEEEEEEWRVDQGIREIYEPYLGERQFKKGEEDQW